MSCLPSSTSTSAASSRKSHCSSSTPCGRALQGLCDAARVFRGAKQIGPERAPPPQPSPAARQGRAARRPLLPWAPLGGTPRRPPRCRVVFFHGRGGGGAMGGGGAAASKAGGGGGQRPTMTQTAAGAAIAIAPAPESERRAFPRAHGRREDAVPARPTAPDVAHDTEA